MPFKYSGDIYHTRTIRKCKYCENSAKRNIMSDGRNKGFYKTCGSKQCLEMQYNDPNVTSRKIHMGASHPKWKPLGSKRIHDGTYIQIKVRNGGKWVYEHRWIVSQKLGRPLKKNEVVHHVNSNGLDNRLENLLLTNQSEHMKIHNGGKK